jgi:hypothetical protein
MKTTVLKTKSRDTSGNVVLYVWQWTMINASPIAIICEPGSSVQIYLCIC